MSIPSSYNQIVSSPIGVPVKITGGVRTPFVFTVGMAYRFHNFGSSSATLYAASSGGSALLTIAAGSTGDYTATQDTYWLLESATSNLLVEPLITTMQSGVARSPLSYVVQMAAAENATLVGTFFSAGGVALVPPGTSDAVVSVAATGDPETLGYLLFGSSAVWIDAVEFRGVLQGGPLLVVEGSPACNVGTPETGYSPLSYGLIVAPGPVILGPKGVEQPARNTGTCVEPASTVWDTELSNEMSQYVDIDVSGAGMTRLFVEWNLGSGESGDLTVAAYPMCFPNDRSAKVSGNANVQETFFTVESQNTNHIELESGKYRIVFSTTQSYGIGVWIYLQRFQ